jgi:hypothetical protein
MHVKNRNNKNGRKTEPCMLSKEDLLVCAFYKIDYLSCIGVVLPKFLNLFASLLHHILGVIRIDILNQSCSKSNLVPAHNNSRS